MIKKYLKLLMVGIMSMGLAACSENDEPINPDNPSQEEEKKEEEPEKPELTEETKMNETIDAFLADYYLWNDEYKEMTRDLTIPFVDSYENFLRTTLMGMTTNTLDKKKNASGTYKLYSYVDRMEKKPQSKGIHTAGVNNGIEKEDKINTYGLSLINGVNFTNTGSIGIVVQSVYPGSSASAMDVKRGTYIFKVNGTTITKSNYPSLYLNLLSPKEETITLTVGDLSGKTKDVTLMATEIDPNPIMMNTVIEEGNHKIGYLIYESFDAAYDNELLAAIAELKSKGITELVLDLRYNPGGHVISVQMLAACLIGNACQDKTFMYYRYNNSRMKNVEATKRKTGNDYDTSTRYFYDRFMFTDYYGVNLGDYVLDIDRIYILVTSKSASGSEVLINVLQGIDYPVEVIGEQTAGKNVGMELFRFDEGDYTYEVAPITFQYYNSKKVTVPSDGLKADYYVSDWNNGFIDFGERNEPMLAKAIELITGKSSSTLAESRMAPDALVKQFTEEMPPICGHHPRGVLVLRKDK